MCLAGCEFTLTRQLSLQRAEAAAITEITLIPGSGDVTIRTGDISTVQVNAKVHYRGEAPDVVHRVDGTTLILYVDCGRRCSASFDVLAPTGVAVRGENGAGDVSLTGVSTVDLTLGSGSISIGRASGPVTAETMSGDIKVTDLDGPARVRTASGDIRLIRLAGPVSAQTTSGDISGTALRGGEVTTRTESGDITLSLDNPSNVRATTASGSVTLTVPDRSYQIHTATHTGEIEIGVRDEPGALHRLDLRTASGDITVRAR